MIQKFSRFVNTGSGLEKTLRLIQCVSQVVAALTESSALAVQLTTVKLQLALSKWSPLIFRHRACDMNIIDADINL